MSADDDVALPASSNHCPPSPMLFELRPQESASPAPPAPDDLQAREREAAAILAEALAQANGLHLPGARDAYRGRLERAIELSRAALASNAVADAKTISRARSCLLRALVARAQDSLHGVNQLSQASQRAPTRDACDDGWQRVEEVVLVAEASAAEAAQLASKLGTLAAAKAARKAETAAKDARAILERRNQAYAFHTDPGFSFGEGWYLAAAGLLAGVSIQVEPGKAQSAQAERFLRDAGLGPKLVPYRPRPPANKPLPETVARAFRADPFGAQRKLRAAFLGDGPIPQAIVDWTDRALAGAPAGRKVLVWVRHGAHQPERNSTYPELVELSRRALAAGLVPVLIGDAVRDGALPPGAADLTLFWKQPLFQGEDMRRAQLQLFEHLRSAHGLVGQLGVTTAGMDGPALMGLPTMYLTDAPNVRLGTWVGAVPGYEEVVRRDDYLARISQTLKRWADEGPGPVR